MINNEVHCLCAKCHKEIYEGEEYKVDKDTALNLFYEKETFYTGDRLMEYMKSNTYHIKCFEIK